MRLQRNGQKWLEQVSSGATRVNLRAGEKIFSQSESADAVYYVRQGTVKYLVRSSSQARMATVALFNSGEFFGVDCVMGQRLRTATAVALTDCSLFRVQSSQMARLLKKKTSAAKFFIDYLISRVDRDQDDLIGFRFHSSEKRLASLLLSLAQFKAKSRTKQIIPRLHQQDLADMVGTTRSRVNHFMNHFRELGLIDYNRNIRVHRGLRDLIVRD